MRGEDEVITGHHGALDSGLPADKSSCDSCVIRVIEGKGHF